MNKLPDWMQWCIIFCAITGAVFWTVFIIEYLKVYA